MNEMNLKGLYDGNFYHVCTNGLEQVTLLKDEEADVQPYASDTGMQGSVLSLYLKNKYGLKKVLHRTDDCISLIDTATYMKNCIAYILRNAVCARICAKPEDYRWSSYACYFSDARSEKSFLVSELTFSQKRKMLRIVVALDSFVRSDIVERVYRYSGKSFL